jgi:3-keto-5-aminohexanoate cleavage enzyme
MAKKIIVTVCPTSNFHGKEANPALPEQPKEIADATYDCYNAGAAIAHLHARDKKGVQTNDAEVIKEINTEVRAKCNIILQDSTAPALSDPTCDVYRGLYNSVEAAAATGAEMCSLDCGISVATFDGKEVPIMWTRKWMADAAKLMKEKGIKPELECKSSPQMEDVYNFLIKPGLIEDPPSYTFVLNMRSQGSLSYSMDNLMYLRKCLPEGSQFTTMGVGSSQLHANMASLLLGGGVRVGFEDNIYYSKGVLAKSNAQLVERIAKIAIELGYDLATPDEARDILNLKRL